MCGGRGRGGNRGKIGVHLVLESSGCELQDLQTFPYTLHDEN